VNAQACLAIVVVLAALTGCADNPPAAAWSMDHYLASPAELMRVRSVAFVELASPLADAPRAQLLGQSLYEDVQHRGLFSVQYVARDDFRCRSLPLDVNRQMDYRQMQQIRQALGCDAIILGEMSHFQQYPRARAGLHLCMVDLREGTVLWAVKHAWDGSDRETTRRIRKYWRENVRDGYEPANEDLVQMSPHWFLKFVSHEAVSTLPTRDELLRPPATSHEPPGSAEATSGKQATR